MQILCSFSIITLLFLSSCAIKSAQGDLLSESQQKAQKIIDKAIKAHGGKHYENLNLEFDFRKRHYKVKRNGGDYTYERAFQDKDENHIHDILSNSDFRRTVNDQETSLLEKKASGYANSINSVVYFVLLPYLLNDPAVMKDYLGEETINGTAYHKVKVTFRQEGGGKDFEDEYCYWINQNTYTMDYLAYNFHVNGGGARFRSAYNVRTVNGIRFADYINYKPIEDTREVATFGDLYQKNGLKELSKIETENIIVH